MVKKYVKVVFSVLSKINKKTFSFVFFAVIFSLSVFFQSAEEMTSITQAFSFQSAEEITLFAQAPPGPPPCVPHCGSCACCYCNYPPCCDCSCAGPSSQTDAVGYVQNRDCIKNINCGCCSCTATCTWSCWYDMEWCGDEINNDTEDCDGANAPYPSSCTVPNSDYPAGLPNDGLSDTLPYDGLILCDMCDWQYDGVDGGATDNQDCLNSTSCDKARTQCDCSPSDRTCTWEADCTPIDWCGDGNINGPELYCDIHQTSGTVDFGGQTCATKICGDIDPTDTEDKSLHSKNPGCLAEMAAYGGNLTCVNTCRHIYTVPACEFPLNATGVDLSDDGLYVFVTDSSLWSLQEFTVADPTKVVTIHYFDTEPLSIDVVGNYAYVGTKGEFAIVNTNQL